MRKIETYGRIKDNGEIAISHADQWTASVKQNFTPGVRFRLTAERLYKKRSTKSYNEETDKEGLGQNGYYFGVVIYEFQEGYFDAYGELCTKEKAHAILKQECNFKEIINQNTGEIRREPKSTADLTTVQFEEYLQRCRDFIQEWFNRKVLLPNEQVEMELNITES